MAVKSDKVPVPDKKVKLAKTDKGDKAGVIKTEETDEGGKKSKLGWLVGWVLVPAAVMGSIFGAGALVGAHYSESWFTRAILWFVDLF